MKKDNRSVIVRTAAFLMSFVSLLVVISSGGNLCSTKGSEIAVGLISVCATLIVGFQIYNTIEAKAQFDKLEEKYKKIEDLQTTSKILQETILRSESTMIAIQIINDADHIYHDDSHHYREASPEFALLKIFDAIIPALAADWRGTAFDSIFNAMDTYIEHIGQSGIVEYCRRVDGVDYPVKNVVSMFNLNLRSKSDAIQSHSNYYLIYKEFEQRLSKIEKKLVEVCNTQ